MRRVLVLFLTLYLLRALVAVANDALAPLHMWLFEGGLFVVYAALALPLAEGMTATLLAGLLCDAAAPVPFGTHAALFGVAHAVLHSLRERVQRDLTAVRLAAALAANAAIYLVLAFMGSRHFPAGAAPWPRIGADLAWSEAVLALIGPWFFALQERALELARTEPGTVR